MNESLIKLAFKSILFLICWTFPLWGLAQDRPGLEVAVVYNKSMAESREVAEYYAKKRNIPEDRLIGLRLPKQERISREAYEGRLEKPLYEALLKRKLITLSSKASAKEADSNSRGRLAPSEFAIRYLVLCRGVPLKIENQPHLQEEITAQLPDRLQVNHASVDSELSLLPVLSHSLPRSGFVANPLYGSTNRSVFNPVHSQILMVARLDGPTPLIAKGLVDKALQAESNGLWGRVFVDARGIDNGNYKSGDDWMTASAEIFKNSGWPVVLDQKAGVFPGGFPMPQIAFYAGWYQVDAGGAFGGDMDFMPGAIAYHLHSYSAQTLRSATSNWAGPLLWKGATATFGCVYEPYLRFTPDLPVFFDRFLRGFSLGESFYASMNTLSWQATLIGDPLYRPFAVPDPERHQQLLEEKNPLIAWAHLKVVNIHLANQSYPVKGLIQYLHDQPMTGDSALLQEKLGDLNVMENQWEAATEAFRRALDLSPVHDQKLNLLLALASTCVKNDRLEEGYGYYAQLAREFPDFWNIHSIYGELASLAKELEKQEEAARWGAKAKPRG